MVCDGPDPPENNPHELNLPPRHDLIMNGNIGEESDEENHDNFGYEPLPQGPITHLELDNYEHSEDEDEQSQPSQDLPAIESVDLTLTRELWNTPRASDPIQMDSEKAQQVMSAMANFVLPQTSIPDWAQSMSEEQWKQSLRDKIETLKKNNR